jgi:hypothetical protein
MIKVKFGGETVQEIVDQINCFLADVGYEFTITEEDENDDEIEEG